MIIHTDTQTCLAEFSYLQVQVHVQNEEIKYLKEKDFQNGGQLFFCYFSSKFNREVDEQTCFRVNNYIANLFRQKKNAFVKL